VRVERQEAFFLGHAGAAIEALLAESAGAATGRDRTLSSVRQTLMELLHPAHLGHKFQIISARRNKTP
jgi:SAM-dependent MidA family methyltransferase